VRRSGGVIVRLLIALIVVGAAFGPAPPPVTAGGSDLLPDLRMDPLDQFRTEVSGGQRRLRFRTVMTNKGSGPLEVHGKRDNLSQPHLTTRQRIFDPAGGSRYVNSRALMEYARDGHDHWHIQGVMLYQLWSASGATRRGTKVGFCFLDSVRRGAPSTASRAYNMSICGDQGDLTNKMGLSVGWGDDYPADFAYQWIDISTLVPGDYTVQAKADEQNWYIESNESNNCAWARVRITSTNGPLTVVASGQGACQAPPASTAKVERQYGDDRFQTAAAVSEDAFAPGVPVAYVATGEKFPDALVAGAAAGFRGGPVILVKQNYLPALAIAELERLNPGRIVVVGGPQAVSDYVFGLVNKYQTGGGTTRVFGGDRYGTAAAISRNTFPTPGVGVPAVYVASGENWPDALAAVPYAARAGGPVLLVLKDSIPNSIKAELDRLNPGRIIIAGGPSAVSNAVATQLDAYDTGPGVQRVSGFDRYGTAAALSKHHYPVPPARQVAYVATGSNFPDAIGAGPAAARRNAPIILVQATAIPSVSATELNRLNLRRILLLGGTRAITMTIHTRLEQYADGG